jgi:hypothetical protein
MIVAEGSDMLIGLDALVERAGQEEQELRNYLQSLSDRLQTACSRADIYCTSDNLQLEACGDDESVFGHIYCNEQGLKIASTFSGDTVLLMPGEEITYSVTSVKECPLPWLRAICRREVIEAFLTKVQERVLQRTDELRSRVVELATLALPADHSAAADFQKFALELGFGKIAADWRTAQVRAVGDPETAIRAACTMIESVCKHILDDKRETYASDADLGILFKSARKALGLDPDAGTDEMLQRIVGGLNNSVQGIGMLRNRASDAHGKSLGHVALASAHAKLAVNAAGAIVTFLLERWKVVKSGTAI